MDSPIAGDIQDFLDGITTLKSVHGGPVTLEARGAIVLTNVLWKRLTENQQKNMGRKGWFKFVQNESAAWGAES